jgi:outer membrane protein assembly factor BamB
MKHKLIFLLKKRKLKLILLILIMVNVISCSSSFLKKDKSQEPSPLLDISPKVKLTKLWSKNVKHGLGKLKNQLPLGFDQSNVYIASDEGLVEKYNFKGKLIWSKRVNQLSTGVGVGEANLAVVSKEGDLILFEKIKGEEIWRKNLSAEVLVAPKISKNILVVQTYDGRLIGLDILDGKQLWVHTVDVPVLTLRGTAEPVIENNRIFSGFSNGKLKSIDLNNGDVIWEQRVAISRGESDIERIIDIDASPLVTSNRAFASSYNGHLMSFDKSNGRPLWRVKNSTYKDLAEGFRSIYSVDDNSSLLAFDFDSGDIRWEQGSFLYRDLSAPIVFKGYLLVLDFDGYIHIMSQINGNIIGREKVSSTGTKVPMIAKEERLFVYTNDGKLVVYNLENIIPKK